MTHPYTYIDPNAKVAPNAKIDPFTVIHGDVQIGEGTWIGSNVTIMDGTRIGKNCRIFPGAVLGAVPQDLKFEGEETTVEIGDRTVIRECVTIHRATKDRWKTIIGNDCLLMTYVHIAHDCHIGNNVILASYVGLSGHVTIQDHAILEGMVAAQQFVTVGAHAFVGGASLIRKNIPPFIKCAREPLTFAGVNSIGLRRRGFSDDEVREIENIYRVLYVQNNNMTKGIEQVRETMPESPLQVQILNFIESSDKGVIKGMI